MMTYMLDTDTCIYLINRHSRGVREHLEKMKPGEVCISSITLSELAYGVEHSAHHSRNAVALQKFLAPLVVESYGPEAALRYGIIRSALQKKGKPIGGMDLLIAAHAVALEVTLVTNNTREFSRVPDVRLENWLR